MANLLSKIKEERVTFFNFITLEAAKASKEAYDGVHTLISHIDWVEQEKNRVENNFEKAVESIKKLAESKLTLILEKGRAEAALVEAKTKPFLNLWRWLKSKL